MRKLLSCILILMLIPFCNISLASDYSPIDMEFQIGSYVAIINGETKAIEAPFFKNGVSMVPLDALDNSFSVTNNIVIYNNTTITFTVGSNIAYVNDEAKNLPAIVEKRNDSYMVPIRFICDNFNVLIEYEDGTGIIRLRKSADYSDIFKRPVSGYWCNEDYGWMLQLPTDYDLSEKVYDGSETTFVNAQQSIALIVYAEKTDMTTLTQAVQSLLSATSGDILRGYSYITLSCGTQAFLAEYYDYAIMIALKDGLLYQLEVLAKDSTTFSTYKEEGINALKSFRFKIDKSLNPENTSELNEGGYVKYTDKTLGFSFNRLESWSEPENLAVNMVTWNTMDHPLLMLTGGDDIIDSRMVVEVFSTNPNDTLEKIVAKEEKDILSTYNPKFLKAPLVSDIKDRNDNKGKLVTFSVDDGNITQEVKGKFFIMENYICVALSFIRYYSGRTLNEKKMKEINDMYESITFTGVDENIGKIINSSSIIDNSILKPCKNIDSNFYVEIPAHWKTNTYSEAIICSDIDKRMVLEVSLLYNANEETLKKTIYNTYSLDNVTNSRTSVSGQNTTLMKGIGYEYNTAYDFYIYSFIYKNTGYVISIQISKIFNGKSSEEIHKKIINSFKLI
ncbi:MAG: copper amine oxidase N-terminal domain-containing protein [Clostridia bacterium]|nr:copper amine oxidase N-terminal domain-containing protein [Clostridia bacterium]